MGGTPLDPQEALKLLDALVGQLPMNREGHVRARHAVEVIKTALNPKRDDPDARPE